MRDDDAAASLLNDDAKLWDLSPALTYLKAVPFQMNNDDIYLRLPV